jgi:hypothetical protein
MIGLVFLFLVIAHNDEVLAKKFGVLLFIFGVVRFIVKAIYLFLFKIWKEEYSSQV